MKYVHPADRLRPWFGVAVGLAALVGMLAFAILGRNFGTLEHLKALNEAGSWLAMSLIEASAAILAPLLAAVALGSGPGAPDATTNVSPMAEGSAIATATARFSSQ